MTIFWVKSTILQKKGILITVKGFCKIILSVLEIYENMLDKN